MLEKFWVRYSANPTRSIIKSFTVPIFKAPFPALTICPLIPPMASRRKKVFESLRLPPNITETEGRFLVRYMYFFINSACVKSKLTGYKISLRYGPAFANENAPGGKAHVKQLKLLLNTNNMTLIDLIKALRPCEDLFESCAWNELNINCSELFKVSYTIAGVCCSFNYLLEDYISGR